MKSIKWITTFAAMVFLLALLAIPWQRGQAAAENCFSYVAGNWTTPGTWTSCGGGYPGSDDTASIGHAVTVDAVTTIVKLAITSGGSLTLDANLTLTGSSGDVLDLNAGDIDLNNRELVMSGNGGNIRVCNGERIIGGIDGSKFTMTNPKTVVTASCGIGYEGTLTFSGEGYDRDTAGQGVLVTLDHTLALKVKFDPGGLTTINGTLKITKGGEVVTNSPYYGEWSKLVYNTGGAYANKLEWAEGDSGTTAGVPSYVELSGGSTNVTLASNQYRMAMGDVATGAGATLTLAPVCSAGTCALTVKGWYDMSGAFVHNSRAVILDSESEKQFIISNNVSTTFYDLILDNVYDVEMTGIVLIENTLDMQNGNLILSGYDLTILENGSIDNGDPGSDRMIIADAGQVCKTFTGTDSYTFLYPIGDNGGPDYDLNYSPFELELPSATYSGYKVCVSVFDARHPYIGSFIDTEYLYRYWTIIPSGTSGLFSGTFYYDGNLEDADPGGDVVLLDPDPDFESNIYGVQFDPYGGPGGDGVWTFYNLVNPGPGENNHYFEVSDIPMLDQADYTGLPKGRTAVTMADMEAVSANGGVLLRWTTGLETEIAGFNLYRAAAPGGEQTLLTPSPTPCQFPGLPQGASYEFLDSSAQAGVTYYYWVETIGPSGSTVYGPLEASWWHRIFAPFLTR